MGMASDALDMGQRSVQILKRSFGSKHPETIGAQQNWGRAQLESGLTNESIGTLRECADNFKNVFGSEHPENGTILRLLAKGHLILGHSDEAKEILEELLKNEEKRLGELNGYTSMTCYLLGSIYDQKGDIIKAKEFYKRALNGFNAVYGPEHPITNQCAETLGYLENQ